VSGVLTIWAGRSEASVSVQTAKLEGGRVDHLDVGSTDAPVVFVLDGYGSRLVGRLAAEHADEAGVRIIAPDRPGYWRSAPRDGDPLETWPRACAELLDHLDVAEAAVLGSSAGCPLAFATASALGSRITAVAIVGPMAPLDDVADLSDMISAQRRTLELAARRPSVGGASMRMMGALARRSARLMLRLVASQRPEVDAARMAEPRLRDLMLESIPGLMGPGVAGELAALVGDWGHHLDELTQPVRIWVGTEDSVHPRSMAAALGARVPGAEVVEVDGGFFDCTDRMDEVLRWAASTG
jgi:pimeloyl-ACP methyl ester carboxylesterase